MNQSGGETPTPPSDPQPILDSRETPQSRHGASPSIEVALAALQAIVDLQPVPYDFPADWQEQVEACTECKRWATHPIQQGICDAHRHPLRVRERHDKDEVSALGYRAKTIARDALAAIDAPEPVVIKPRIIDGKFQAEVRDGAVVIVKTSSGEIVPEDEPLILQRGRDHLMVPNLRNYRQLSVVDGCNDYHLAGVDAVIAGFVAYASDPSRMKQPGVTRGAAWNPEAVTTSQSHPPYRCGAWCDYPDGDQWRNDEPHAPVTEPKGERS